MRGSAVPAKTEGIWIWCRPHPHKAKTCLMLLYIEGLGDAEKKQVLFQNVYGREIMQHGFVFCAYLSLIYFFTFVRC